MYSSKVLIAQLAEKQLRKVPVHIQNKLLQWIERVEEYGIGEVRLIKGFHDEPLKGARKGEF